MNQPLADTLIGNADVVMMHGERAVYIDGFARERHHRCARHALVAGEPPAAVTQSFGEGKATCR
jgi:hypothetical protein